MSDDRQSDPDVDYTMHTRVHCHADALARNAIAVLRIALIVVGIPLVWIYRTELDWSIWKAAAATLVLVLLATGQTVLAAVWSP